MKEGKHIGIELNPSKHVHLSAKDFDKLSCIGLACFLINHPVVLEQKKDHVRIYSVDYRVGNWLNYPRLKKFKAFVIESVELAWIEVPNTDPLRAILNHKFEKYFLREDESEDNV